MKTFSPLTDKDLADLIDRRGIPARLIYPGVPTRTVPTAAAALGVEAFQIIKSLVFLVDGDPMLVVAAGEERLSIRRLADAFGTSKRHIRLAGADEALELTGFVVGAMPPFGHVQHLPTYLDRASVRPGMVVYGGGGSVDAMLELSVETLLEVTGGRWLHVAK
jgi:prolyl-tRNA editing enzyme YbaK/EbsC (Cys-tRNA(Pro) deacylase)